MALFSSSNYCGKLTISNFCELDQSPPSLPKLTKPFSSLKRILQSSLLHKMQLMILTRCCEESQKNWIDPLLHPTLYLIGMAFGEIENAYREGWIDLQSELSMYGFIQI